MSETTTLNAILKITLQEVRELEKRITESKAITLTAFKDHQKSLKELLIWSNNRTDEALDILLVRAKESIEEIQKVLDFVTESEVNNEC